MLHHIDFIEPLAGQFRRQRFDTLPQHGGAGGGVEFPGQ